MVISSGEGWGAGQGDETTDPRDREVEPQTPGLGTSEDVEEEENRRGFFSFSLQFFFFWAQRPWSTCQSVV